MVFFALFSVPSIGLSCVPACANAILSTPAPNAREAIIPAAGASAGAMFLAVAPIPPTTVKRLVPIIDRPENTPPRTMIFFVKDCNSLDARITS